MQAVDRNKYLKMCQLYSIIESRDFIDKDDRLKSVEVVYNGIRYYPFGYSILFDKDGVVIHSAILKDINADSIVSAKLNDVFAMIDKLEYL